MIVSNAKMAELIEMPFECGLKRRNTETCPGVDILKETCKVAAHSNIAHSLPSEWQLVLKGVLTISESCYTVISTQKCYQQFMSIEQCAHLSRREVCIAVSLPMLISSLPPFLSCVSSPVATTDEAVSSSPSLLLLPTLQLAELDTAGSGAGSNGG